MILKLLNVMKMLNLLMNYLVIILAAILCQQDDSNQGDLSGLFSHDSSLEGPPVCEKTAMVYYVSW